MTIRSQPVLDKSNRAAVTAMTPSRASGPQRTFASVAATMKRIAERTAMAALLVGCILAIAVSFAPTAAAKGQEGGVVCTGTQMTAGTCRPNAMQSTPIGSIPLGCKPSGNDTVACGRLGYHEFAAAPRSAGSAASGPAQALATPAGGHSDDTAATRPRPGGHAAR